MLLKAKKQILVWGGVLILIAVLWQVNRSTELSPWVWAAFLAGAGLGAFGLYLTDRSDGLVLLAAYVLWAISGLVALVPSNILRGQTVALYVLSAIALPFLIIFIRDRARWWALIPAYPLIAIVGVIGLTKSGIFGDGFHGLVSTYVLSVITLPFFVIYAWDHRRWWALIPGGIIAAIGLSFLLTRGAVGYAAALVLLVVSTLILVRAFVDRGSSGEAALPGPDEPAAPPAE